MALSIRANLVAGRPNPEYVGQYRDIKYESAHRRGMRLMCDGCKRGAHSMCESEDCPCVCNDSDFRWARRTGSARCSKQLNSGGASASAAG
jgi:hypothetical protein